MGIKCWAYSVLAQVLEETDGGEAKIVEICQVNADSL